MIPISAALLGIESKLKFPVEFGPYKFPFNETIYSSTYGALRLELDTDTDSAPLWHT